MDAQVERSCIFLKWQVVAQTNTLAAFERLLKDRIRQQRCPHRGCPTAAGRCRFHQQSFPRGFAALDRMVRARGDFQ